MEIATADRRERIDSIDLLRGTVMILMALDHTRDYFSDMLWADPHNLSEVTPLYFLTRWVTHFCAPVFLFLAGVGAALYEDRGRTKSQLARFLLTRGLWLVLVELTLVRLGFWFSLDLTLSLGQVLWAIGWSMVVLGGLCWLPRWMILGLGVAMILGHNLTDSFDSNRLGRLEWLWILLHDSTRENAVIDLGHGFIFMAPYKLIPWCGVMMVGYGMGPIWRMPRHQRRRLLTILGIMVCAAFAAIRGWNGYGDPKSWVRGDSALLTILSFINCAKYPPSLDYLLMTLGPAMIALAWFDREPGWLGKRISVIGRVPLFFYLLHVPLIHVLACATSWLAYRQVLSWLIAPPYLAFAPRSYGYGLPYVYGAWALVVLILYLPCIWWDREKKRDRSGWLSYL